MLNYQASKLQDRLRPRFWKKLFFPQGLYGLENIHEYYLFSHKEEKPYMRLQAKTDPQIGFLLLDPFIIQPEYQPHLTLQDLNAIGVENEGEAYLMCIVNIENWPKCRLNLTGPLLINWQNNIGKQIIALNY